MNDRQEFYRRLRLLAPDFAKAVAISEAEALRRLLTPPCTSGEQFREQWARRQSAKQRRAIEEARKIPPQDRQWVFQEAGWTCVYCGDVATEIDHILPVSRGGNRRRRNLAAACRSCNREKVIFTPKEWRVHRLEHGLSWPPEPYLVRLVAEVGRRQLP